MNKKIITNGFPKTGNHALVKAVQLLGLPCDINHIPYSPLGDVFHLHIIRDPRDIISAWLQFIGKLPDGVLLPKHAGLYMWALRDFGGRPFFEQLAEYEPWLKDLATLNVRYEDLCKSDAEMRRIAAWLGVPYIEGAFEDLPGGTYTWFPTHPDWRGAWTPEVDALWNHLGGADVLTRWGY